MTLRLILNWSQSPLRRLETKVTPIVKVGGGGQGQTWSCFFELFPCMSICGPLNWGVCFTACPIRRHTLENLTDKRRHPLDSLVKNKWTEIIPSTRSLVNQSCVNTIMKELKQTQQKIIDIKQTIALFQMKRLNDTGNIVFSWAHFEVFFKPFESHPCQW